MDFNSIVQAISTVGFPIAMCCGLCWYALNQNKEHKEEMNKMVEAVNNNTIVLKQVLEHFRNGGDNNE